MMNLVPCLILIPLGGAFFIPILGKKIKWLGGAVSIAASLLLAVISVKMLYMILRLKTLSYNVGSWTPPAGIELVVDSFGVFMLVTANAVALMVSLYSFDYVKKYTDTWKFHSLFLMMLTGINGVIISGDIFSLYVFLEMAAITGYFLVAFGTEAEDLEAAFKYAVMGIVASAFILLGIAFLYSYASTLNMADMAKVLAVSGKGDAVRFVTVLFLMGFGLKAALFPFHSWLPYAHSQAPSPISAMLSGVSIKVLGIYALARIFFTVFGTDERICGVLVVLGILSMCVGAFLALGQTDMKRLFAYSSISQIGYIALAFGVATPLAIIGGLFHLFNHSVFKSLLFLNSGAIENIYGTRDIRKISGVISACPVTGYTTLAGALSICGIPPLGGFWSKLIIIIACFQAARPGLAFTAIAVSALTLAYYFKALTPVLFGAAGPELSVAAGSEARMKPTAGMNIAVIALAALVFLSAFALLPNPANRILNGAAYVLAKPVAEVPR